MAKLTKPTESPLHPVALTSLTGATFLREMVNAQGQTIMFYECPKFGQDACILAVHKESLAACATSFYDLDDLMTTNGDYNVIFVGREAWCAFEFDSVPA